MTAAEMSSYAGEQTARRVAGREVVAIQDTSELVLGGRRKRASGYGPVGKGGVLSGLLLHPVLAVEVGSEALLGLVSMEVWNRKGGGQRSTRRQRTTSAKESQRWVNGLQQAGEVLDQAASVTGLCDREGDMYELFAHCPANMHLVVRACQNRRIEQAEPTDERLLFDLIDRQAEQGRVTVQIPAAPGRQARTAEFAVRFVSAKLCRPLHGADPMLPATLAINLVEVSEVAPPADGSKPIRWRLLTTHTVTTVAEAQRVVELYRLRWIIEEFFSTLKKAGFDIEAAEISDPAAMINFVAAATVAAITVKQLVQARDGTTNQPLTDAFAAEDQPLIEALSASLEGKTDRQRNPHPKGMLAFASWVIARLGGWTGYYGKPGPKVMRIGLTLFQASKQGYSLGRHDV